MRFMILAISLAMLLFASPALAEEAADFKLEDLNGDEYTLDDLLDGQKLLVIDFWQVGCKPCNELVAHLQEFYDEYQKDEAGVEIVIISRDTTLTLPQVAPFFNSHEYTFKVLLDTELDVSGDYGVKASPVTFLIDKDKQIIWRHFNYKSGQEEEIRAMIDAYLAGEEIPEEDSEAAEEEPAEEE
ncbi:TlpA family protein disulfide reductase [bacterium]|nr:TlpA family protein disulfide reductase [bacterium]